MGTEPTDRTSIGGRSYRHPSYHTEDVPYVNYSRPEFMPGAALAIETINEWATWWHWHIDHVADAARQVQHSRAPHPWAWAIEGDPT